jgi:hypothetical protein
LEEVEQLRRGDFPHQHSRECLLGIEKLFVDQLANVDGIDAQTSPDVQTAVCLNANMIIFRYHSLLGFVLRSTNIRNSFEIFDPLLRISKLLLGPDAKLVLSSEWNFSPFTFSQVFPELPGFVFIGLPASEFNNALIIPAAGHELGHTVWRIGGFISQIELELRPLVVQYCSDKWTEFQVCFNNPPDKSKLTTDMLLISHWTPAATLALRQSEEVFCDFLGVRLFGEGFLHSFEYLIAPNVGRARHPSYPGIAKRAEFMVQSAQAVGASQPTDFATRFFEVPLNLGRAEKFLLAASDWATEQIIPNLIKKVNDFADGSGAPRFDIKSIENIYNDFKDVHPASEDVCFADIVNAAWRAYLTPDFWPEETVPSARKFEVISELAFKSIEVLEYQTRMKIRNVAQV